MSTLRVKSPKSQFTELLPNNRINPLEPISKNIEIVADLFGGPDSRPMPGKREFTSLKAGVLLLLEHAHVLNRQDFWNYLDYERDIREVVVPEESRNKRLAKISAAKEQLGGDTASLDDVIDAMDTVYESILSMFLQFTYGRVDSDLMSEYPVEPTYMCAAMLPPMSQLLATHWLPVRGEFDKKHGSSKKRKR